MKRREFIAGIAGAAAWPLVARAQQPERMRRVGVLMPYNENDDLDGKHRYSVFTQSLAGLGWTDGSKVQMDLRWGGGDINRIQVLARELVGTTRHHPGRRDPGFRIHTGSDKIPPGNLL